MDFDKLLFFISGAGFAVFVVVWFMLRLEAKMEQLSKAISEAGQSTALLVNLVGALFRQNGIHIRKSIRGSDISEEKQ